MLSACHPPEQQQTSSKNSDDQLQSQFQQWKSQQNPELIAEYDQFMSQYLKHPPSLMELTTTRNKMPRQCDAKRFAIPPKRYWKNVVRSLQLIEKLNNHPYFKKYMITAIYRDSALNKCIGGAAKNQYLYNFTVDFHVLDPQEIIKKIVNYWLNNYAHFEKLKLSVSAWVSASMAIIAILLIRKPIGLGVKIKSQSSPCLKVNALL